MAQPQYSGGLRIIPINYSQIFNRQNCVGVTFSFCTNPGGGAAGPGCYDNEDGGAHVVTISYEVCSADDDFLNLTQIIADPAPGSSNGGGGAGGGGGGSPTPGSYPAGLPSTPIPSDPNSPLSPVTGPSENPVLTEPVMLSNSIRLFVRDLDVLQKAWWNNPANAVAVGIITEYLNDNGISDETNAFAQDLIENCINNNLNTEEAKDYVISNIIVEQIDDSQLDDCTKGVLNKLKGLQQNDIAKIMERFDAPESVVKIVFSQEPNLVDPDTQQSVYGLFLPTNTSLNYIIKLNANFYKDDGATNLGKATTIVHEIMHALIASIIQNQNSSNNTDMTDFPAIWNAYVNIERGSTTPDDHLFMGNHYVNIMGSILQEYATGVPVPDGQTPEQLYTDLAWQGLFPDLSPTTPFDSILTGTDIIRIWARKQAEMTNEYTNGIYPTNNPPCLN